MSCYHPLPGYRPRGGGQVSIGHHAGQQGKDFLELPCGRCIGCLLDRSRAWSIRIMHEASLYDANVFATLSYAPEHLPGDLSLDYSHYQRFMKRLRKEVQGVTVVDGKRPIRFFCAGEYGEQYARPHWHAILFNCRFDDQVRFVNGTARSALVERLWRRGQVVLGEVTPASAAYVAGYTQSKVYGREAYEDLVDLRTGEVSCRRPPFCTMSRRPGIGAAWFEKYGSDLFPHDFAVASGKRYKVPSYYWRKFQAAGDPQLVEDITEARISRAQEVDREENTERRRCDREEVAWARLETFSPRRF